MAEEKKVEAAQEEKLLPQSQVDAIVQDRLARERAKFADYEDLRKFKTEHEKQLDQAKQQELEARKEYEKLKEGWGTKEKDYQGVIAKKESEISDMKISGSLLGEISKQNAYAEETMALLKQQAVFDKEGNVRIKGRDANGLEVMDSVEEGVKKFLVSRPHLVRAQQRAGGGTPPGSPGGAAPESNDLNTLNGEYIAANSRGDYKAAAEIKKKIRAALQTQGVKLS
jgi:hypothetical protein